MFRLMRVALLLYVGMGVATFGAPEEETKAVKIRDGVYMAPSSGNVYMVTTPAGNVIVDTATAELAPQAKKALIAESSGPVKWIILTHGHADHTGGIPLWKEAGSQIVAQRNYVEFVNYTERLAGFFAPRNAAQFNIPVPEVGPWAGNNAGKIEANVLFDDTYEFTLGNVRFELLSTPGETPDHLTAWIPGYKIAFIGDNYDAAGIPGPVSFPNLYTLRGTKPRWALDYIDSLNKVLALKPEIVLQGHGDPIVGNKEITQRLTRFRDAIQYVHDETVKGMNSGKDVYTLMREIRLPANLEMEESFGKLTWSIRGIYDGYAGWFDMNPTTMYEWPASTVYPDLVKLAGGPEPLVRLALEKFDGGKPVEALHLTDIVLAYDAKNRAALTARLKVLQHLREQSQNYIEASWLEYGIRTTKERLLAK